MGLGNLTIEGLKQGLASDDFPDLNRVKHQSGALITWVDIKGTGKGSGSMTPPFAGGSKPTDSRGTGKPMVGPVGPPGSANDVKAPNASPGGIPEMSFDVPPDWKPGRINSFRKIAWEAEHDGRTAEIFVSTLSAGGSAIGPNVSRWRNQVGLPALSGENVTETIESIQIDDTSGHYVDLIGEKTSILGAVVIRDGIGWFFKVQGDSSVAEHERDRFKAFLATVKFQ